MARWYRVAVTIFFALFANSSFPAPTVSVLFIGNSLTQANDLPSVFKRFAAESPLHIAVEVRSITPGGAFLFDHWKKGDAIALLREHQPNFLVLQGQSTEPLSSPQNFEYYARLFKAEADRVRARTILLSTWARPASDPYYQHPTSGGSPEEMQRRLSEAYASLAHDLGITLAPVGVAWERVHFKAPAIELQDGTVHPSPAGTYLAAAVLFRAIFSSSDPSSTFYGGLSTETALTLQHVAARLTD